MGPNFVVCGHASDGDARRFLLQLHECRLLAVERDASAAKGSAAKGSGVSAGVRREYLHLECAAFPNDLCAAVDWGMKDDCEVIVGCRGVNNQDPIHNCKKGDSSTRSATKDICLGPYGVDAGNLNLLKMWLKGEAPLGGTSDAAIRRTDRQNFEHVAHRQSRKVTENLRKLQQRGAADTLGLVIVYECLREFMLIWFSETSSLLDRINSAGYVIGLLTRLKLHVTKTKGKTVLGNFWPNQSCRHITWGCLSAVFIVLLHSRQNKGKAKGKESVCALHLTGSDCLERFFANLGGFGKFASWQRNFTFGDAVSMTTKMNHYGGLQHGEGRVKTRKAHHKQECPVHLLEDKPTQPDPAFNMRTPFSDQDYSAAFQLGADRARSTLQAIPDTDDMTADANVPIDIPDTHTVKGSTDGVTPESLAAAFQDLIRAHMTESADESAADPTAPAPKPTRSADTAAAEAVARGGNSGVQHERVTPEAAMLARSDPSKYTDGYLPMFEARKLKAELDNLDHLTEFDTFAAIAASFLAVQPDPDGWIGTKKVPGVRGLGWVANAGNCGVEAIAVGFHRGLVADRKTGVAVFRDSVVTVPVGADGSDSSIDADMHFDPVTNPYGADHPGRPFLQATRHIRTKGAAHALTSGWWETSDCDGLPNKDAATASFTKPGAPTPTVDTVVAWLTKDREWVGELELKTIAEAFDCAIVVYDYVAADKEKKTSPRMQQRGPPYGNKAGMLIEVVYRAEESHYYCVSGVSDEGYADVAALDTSGSGQGAVDSASAAADASHDDGDSGDDDDDGHGMSPEEQLAQELVMLVGDSNAWESVNGATAAAHKSSSMLIDLGGGKFGHARTVLKKLHARAKELRGENGELSKDRLRKITQNATFASSASTIAAAGSWAAGARPDFSEDVLGLYADVAMGFENPQTNEFTVYIGQVNKLITGKASGGKDLFEKTVPFLDMPDDIAMRCTWYKEGDTLSDGTVVYTLGEAGRGDKDPLYHDKQALLGVARLNVRTKQVDGKSTVMSGHFTMDKAQHAELKKRLGLLKPKAQSNAKKTKDAKAKKAAAEQRKQSQSEKPDGRQFRTSSKDRRNKRPA